MTPISKALIDSVVGVAGVCSYTCKLVTFFVMPLTLSMPIIEKYLNGELLKNLTNFGYYMKIVNCVMYQIDIEVSF